MKTEHLKILNSTTAIDEGDISQVLQGCMEQHTGLFEKVFHKFSFKTLID